ncbi:hypothetical protein GCM10023350_06770 [Nocardioides endophyticus]|uniref:Uncharacterized protein n=1 Tax=Nocardioides endophyticus TaxID=1353775 RepID=A0ABP8YGM0_9ACTN
MSRAPEVAQLRRPLALVLLVSGVLALLLPPLLTVGADSLSGAVTVLALALVGLVGLGVHWVSLRARLARAALRSDDTPTPVLSGRVTDPAHHPVRPRAPGLAA